MRIFAVAAIIAAACSWPACAEPGVTVDSAVFVEQGTSTRTLQKATYLARGQRVIMLMDWRSPADGGAFMVMTPVPARLAFERSANGLEEVSVDGGRNWGRLGALQMRDGYAVRLATPEDVTHLRWRIKGARPSGSLTWSALVR